MAARASSAWRPSKPPSPTVTRVPVGSGGASRPVGSRSARGGSPRTDHVAERLVDLIGDLAHDLERWIGVDDGLLAIGAPDGELAERTFPGDRRVAGVGDLGIDVSAAVLVGQRENDALASQLMLWHLGDGSAPPLIERFTAS
jgi:hypothetical protein